MIYIIVWVLLGVIGSVVGMYDDYKNKYITPSVYKEDIFLVIICILFGPILLIFTLKELYINSSDEKEFL